MQKQPNPNHGERAHAEFSPSGISRDIACPASYKLSKGQPDGSSPYAQRGTQLHEASEFVLATGRLPEPNDFNEDEIATIKAYVNFVNDIFTNADYRAVELKVTVNEDCWGTIDAVAIKENKLYVIDLKTGRVPVSADCAQLKVYALGVLKELNWVSDIDEVITVIVQPKDSYHPKTATFLPADIFLFEEVIEDTMRVARADNAPVNVGSQCTWCRAAAVCTAVFDEIEQATTTQAGVMSVNELDSALQLAAVAENWVKRVRERAENEIQAGNDVTGWKLVHGRGIRKWKDDSVNAKLEEIFQEESFEKKYISPTQAEKLMGKANFTDSELAELVIKPQGKLTLAPLSDKRVSALNADFETID